jgi:NADP-dependent 3-hydroxy acid dehydrogenase YdfG
MTTAGPLAGKVALITGASSGIGAATAKALAAAGTRVVLAARRDNRLRGIVDEITARGGQALAAAADIRQGSEIEGLLRKVTDWGGHLDILINNAGTSPLARIEDSTVADLQGMLDTNLAAVIYTTRLALPALRRSGGDIVNIGSVAVKVQNPGSATYAATKAGVTAFSESLRKEVIKDKIRVSVIHPGLVLTGIANTIADRAMRERTIKRVTSELTPLSPEDIAEVVVWILTRPPHVAINDILVRPSEQE